MAAELGGAMTLVRLASTCGTFMGPPFSQVAQAARELDRQIQGLELRISALQKVLSEKELELSRLRKAVSALEAEKEAQVSSMEDLKQEHMQRMRELQLRKVRISPVVVSWGLGSGEHVPPIPCYNPPSLAEMLTLLIGHVLWVRSWV